MLTTACCLCRAVLALLVTIAWFSKIASATPVTVQSSTLETMFLGQEAFLNESSLATDPHYVDESLRLRPPTFVSGPETSVDSIPYTRFRFLLTNSNRNVRGTISSATTAARPTSDAPTLDTTTCPSGRVCNVYDEPVQVSVFASRPVHRYDLTPTGFKIPFGLVTVDYSGATPASPCEVADDCERPPSRTLERPCIEATAATRFLDPTGTISDVSLLDASLNVTCGAERDTRGPLLDSVCQSVCCVPCAAENVTEYRRKTVHAVGPFCRAYRIGTHIVGNDLLATLRIGDNVLDAETVTTNAPITPPDYAVARLRSGTALSGGRVNENGTMRVQVLNHTTTQPERLVDKGDYVLLCDYEEQSETTPMTEPPSQGLYNPYISASFVDLFKAAYESSAHAEVPYNETDPVDEINFYEAVGGGTVPTRAGLGEGRLSWFYITAPHYEYLRARTQADIMYAWYNMQIPLLCEPGDTRLDNNSYVPGLDTTASGAADATAYPTPCQMSARINAYAAQFDADVYTDGVSVAKDQLAAAYPDGPPLGLHPYFLLERPNMHVHATSASSYELIYDAIVDSDRPVFAEIAVDVPDNVLPLSRSNAVVKFVEGPRCSARISANATSVEQLSAAPVLAYNVSAVVAFSVQLVAEEVPSEPRFALSARLDCVNSTGKTYYALQYEPTDSADRRGVFPIDVSNPGQNSSLETLLFGFYTLDADLRAFDACTLSVFQYDASAPAAQRNFYATLLARKQVSCVALLDTSVRDLVQRDMAEDDADDDDDDGGGLGTTATIVLALIIVLGVLIVATLAGLVAAKFAG